MRVAVLALQGAFIEHIISLEKLGVESFEIREKRDLENDFDGLILPGGESTVMRKLLYELDIFDTLYERIKGGMPVFGTCAGMILLAKNITGGEPCFSLMDITVKRNAYGRQLGSFYAESDFKGIGKIPMTFIRAPYAESVSGEAEILSVVEGRIVAVRERNMLATSFHPELCDDLSVHRYFIDMVKAHIADKEKVI
ncbi:MAG: pyridoxal 5'-phosphate synthase glutaminase subunit PdxT [Eubacteriales bacterium]